MHAKSNHLETSAAKELTILPITLKEESIC